MPKKSARKATTKAARKPAKAEKKSAAKKTKPARRKPAVGAKVKPRAKETPKPRRRKPAGRTLGIAAPRALAPAVLTPQQKRTIVHSCIRGCAGNNSFGPNDQLQNIPADAQCVQVCIIDRTGKPVLVSDTDTENDIVGML